MVIPLWYFDPMKELVINVEQNEKVEIDITIIEKIITAAVILPLEGNLVHTRMNSLISFFLPSDNLHFLNITKQYYLKYLNKKGFQVVNDWLSAYGRKL